jgi:exopolyphosphatase/guanosine-5'-triphosphate,3'-diphosphate pyrophosphatase
VNQRFAAIDCGTNSVRLLLADAVDGRQVELDRRMEVVRLGEGVDATGRLSPAALERTFAALRRYAALIRAAGAERVRMVATSASRDAENSDEFVAGVTQILGVAPEVVTGLVEADLSFTGVSRSLPDLAQPTLVVDIGGGSTEFVLGADHAAASVSVDMGCVRMTERHVRSDPPAADELRAIAADVDALIERACAEVELQGAACLAGLAGTVTTVAALALELPRYDPARIHGAAISAEQVHDVAARLAGASRAERLALPVMHPGRADVIVAGSLILDRIVQAVGLPAVVASEHDILDGIFWSMVPAH